MERLRKSLVENKQSDIFAIAQHIENHIAANLQILLQKHRDRLLHGFNRAGDMAYGAYLNFLLSRFGTTPFRVGLSAIFVSRRILYLSLSDRNKWVIAGF